MKRMGLCAMLLGCALLCACGAAPSAGQNLQEQYAAVKTAQLEAEVVCHLEGESRSYTVQCSYDRGGDAVTTITTPEELAGISATVSGQRPDADVRRDGACGGPAAGRVRGKLPAALLRAVSDGYILEQGKETIEGQPLSAPCAGCDAPLGGEGALHPLVLRRGSHALLRGIFTGRQAPRLGEDYLFYV